MGPATNGSKGNYWTGGSAFPTPTNMTLYLGSNSSLVPSTAPQPGTLADARH